MPSNQDTLFRQWHMLRLVPRYPQKVTARQIQSSLEKEGFEVTTRTVQRDLQELSAVFPIAGDEREKPFGWSWSRDARSFDLPGLTVEEALTMTMVERYLGDLLPTSFLDLLQPHFRAARDRLDGEPRPRRGRKWIDKVGAISPNQRLLSPAIDPLVHRDISEALLHERQVEVRYLKRGEEKSVEWRIHPLGLIQRGPMLYLAARVFDYEDVRTLALHRIHSTTILDAAVVAPPDWSLEKSIRTGIMDFGTGEMIRLRLRFEAARGQHLYETPLSLDQEIIALEDGRLEVTATVADTSQLMWWLLGFAGSVEVCEPTDWRELMVDAARSLAKTYRISLT